MLILLLCHSQGYPLCSNAPLSHGHFYTISHDDRIGAVRASTVADLADLYMAVSTCTRRGYRENSGTCWHLLYCWTRTVCSAGYQAGHQDYMVHRGKNYSRGKRAAPAIPGRL